LVKSILSIDRFDTIDLRMVRRMPASSLIGGCFKKNTGSLGRSFPLLVGALFLAFLTVAPASAQLDATMRDTLVNDPDSDNRADPGERLRYTIILSNTGTVDATGIVVAATPDSMGGMIDMGSMSSSPLVFDQMVSATEDTPLQILLFGKDLDGDPLTFTTLIPPASGTLGPIMMTSATSSMVVYTPDMNINGTDMFSFQASDNTAKGVGSGTDSNIATITITVTPIQDPPNAVDDTAMTVEGSPVTINVLMNDSDPDPGDMISVFSSTDGSFGTTSINPDDTITFTPNMNGNGGDSFLYTIQDTAGNMDSASVEVNVQAVNDPPDAMDDAIAVIEGGTADMVVGGGDLLDNDFDLDGMSLVVSATPVAGPFHGSLTLNPDGTFLYTHDGTEGATDEFTYEVCDDGFPPPATCTTALVIISVTQINDLPMAVDDLYMASEDAILSVTAPGLLANDVDDDPAAMLMVTAGDAASASGAVVTWAADGSFNYNPTAVAGIQALASGEMIVDTFSYTISDGTGVSSATAFVTVKGVNDAPIAIDDLFAITQQQTLMGDVLSDNGGGADSDVDATDILAVSAVNGSGMNVGTAFALPSGATLTQQANGSFSYDPNTQFISLGVHDSATDSYTYTISDGNTGTDTANVVIAVSGENDAPVAQNDDFTTDEDTAILDSLFADNGNGVDEDPDATDILAVSAVNGMGANVGMSLVLPSGASVTVTSAGAVSYDPNGAFNGLGGVDSATDTFSYTITDGTVTDTATVVITINGINDPPMALMDTYNALGNTTLIVEATGLIGTPTDTPFIVSLMGNLLANDSDPDTGDVVAVDAEVKSSSGGGTVDIRSDGSFSYVPPSGFRNNPAPDTFYYTARDSGGAPSSASAVVSVSEVIWFIDDTASGGGDGTSATPFNSIVAYESGASDATGDIIFIYEGNSVATPLDAGPGAEGLQLLNEQQVLGEAFGLTIQHPDSATTQVTLVPAGNDPHLTNSTSGGAAISLASNENTVRGLTIVDAAGNGIEGTGVSNMVIADSSFENITDVAITVNALNTTISNVLFENMPGSGIAIGNAAGQTTITDATLLQVAGAGIVLVTPTGNVDIVRPVIQGNTVTALGVVAGNAVVSVTDAQIDVSFVGQAILVSGFGAPGNLTFGGPSHSVRIAGGVGSGVLLNANSGDVTIPDVEMVGAGITGIQVSGDCTGTATIEDASLSGIFQNMILVNGSAPGANTPTLDFSGFGGTNGNGLGVAMTNFGGTVDLSNSTIDAQNQRIFDFDNVDNGGPNLTGAVLDNTNGDGIRVMNSQGTFTFPAVAITNAQANAIHLENNNGGGGSTFNFASLGTVTTLNGGGLFALNGGTVNFVATNTAFNATGGSAIDIQNTAGQTNGAGGWTFAGLSSTGTSDSGVCLNNVINSLTVTGPTTIDGSNTGTGIEISSCPNGVAFADVTVGSSGDPIGGMGAILQNSGTIGFDSLDIFNSASAGFTANTVNTLRVDGGNIFTTGTGSPLSISGSAIEAVTGVNFTSIENTTLNGNRLANLQSITGGPVSIGSATGTSVGGAVPGVEMAGSSANATFGSVALTNFGAAGLNLSNNTGSFTANAGAVSSSAAQGLLVNQGNAGVTVNASISGSGGNAVQVTNRSGGAIGVGGAVTGSAGGILVQGNTAGSLTFSGFCDLNTGAGNAVLLDTNNTAFTTSFNGGTDLTTTTGFGFAASSGGTCNVASGSVNSVTSTTQGAISISTLTAGGSGISFDSVSSNNAGASPGVTINNLSGGAFAVTGMTSVNNCTPFSMNITNLADVNTSVDFADVSITNRNNVGLRIDNADNTTGDIAFGNVTVGVPMTQTGDGVLIQNSDADVDFTSLNIQN
jgi:VCBS repeat-containing protein